MLTNRSNTRIIYYKKWEKKKFLQAIETSKMNRTNNPEFFRAWDLAQQINTTRYTRSKCKLEHIEAIEAFYDTYGFYPDIPYQEAIEEYQQHENAYKTSI